MFELIAREDACALQGAESVSAGRKPYLSEQEVVRQWIPGGPSLYQTSYYDPFTRATVVLEEKGIQPDASSTLLCLLMGWRTALVTGDLHDFILRALDLPRAEPGVELVQGANIFARKMHPGIMFPVKCPFMRLTVKKRHRISIRERSLNAGT